MTPIKRHTMYVSLLALFITGLLAGCAHKGPILTDFAYQPPAAGIEEGAGSTVAVSPFKDNRGKTDSVAGRRFSAVDDQVNDLVVQGTVSDKVSAALKAALKARGLAVKSGGSWDLTDAGIPANGPKLLVSGEIKTLWIEALSSFANAKVTAKVDLRIVVADTQQKKIVRALNVSSTIERQAVAYSKGLVQSTLSEALTTALNQMFSDEEMKKLLL